jgi:hypothetical protein
MASDFILHYIRRIGAPNLTDSRPVGCLTPKQTVSIGKIKVFLSTQLRAHTDFIYNRLAETPAQTWHNVLELMHAESRTKIPSVKREKFPSLKRESVG